MSTKDLIDKAHRVANEEDLQELMAEMRRAGIRPKRDPNRMDFLLISRDGESATVFPSDEREIRYALENIGEETRDRMAPYLTSWPGHGHGPEWRIGGHRPDSGTMVLDLTRDGHIMTPAELKELGLWPEEEGNVSRTSSGPEPEATYPYPGEIEPRLIKEGDTAPSPSVKDAISSSLKDW